MGRSARFQYALGFSIACFMHFKLIQDVEQSMHRQKYYLSLIEKSENAQITFVEESNSESLNSMLFEAYFSRAAKFLLQSFNP
ncbi:hypothetical protein SteCoe_5618 [Stentor coeruleus]|uniref:Uncharacterized protein n=1 Tax=Stentor coeruleus TaxID=5963 RepID=A0A1R2CRX0_9CILI|nr:hypothetical protein SteCoe_5618 [Stentor coeruleus]